MALAAFAVEAFACTSAIVSGKLTANGRPLLWKNRDTNDQNNRVKRCAAHKGCYEFVALFDARDKRDTAAWIGYNEKGFAIMNTASEVGYGNIVSSLPGFSAVRDFLLSIDPGTPLISEALVVNVLAGITGSASGGMSIALEAMGARYLEWAQAVHLNPELLHRVAAMASGGFDTMPHNGAVITLLAITGMTHKKSYPDIGMVSLVIPFSVTLLLIIIWTMFGINV